MTKNTKQKKENGTLNLISGPDISSPPDQKHVPHTQIPGISHFTPNTFQ